MSAAKKKKGIRKRDSFHAPLTVNFAGRRPLQFGHSEEKEKEETIDPGPNGGERVSSLFE